MVYIKKHFVLILFILAFLGGAASQYHRIKNHKENDHWVYYRTATRIANKDLSDIYSLKDGALPFRYSPPTLMLFSWMSNYSEMTSRKIWLVLQSLCILISFRFLYLVLIKIDSPAPLHSIVFSFLLFYRYFLDALYCGQIAGMGFLAFTLGLFYWVNDQKKNSNYALFFLALVKIIPGFLIMINFVNSKSWREFFKLVMHLVFAMILVNAIYFFWYLNKFGFNNISGFISTFKNWIMIVQHDQNYFDGSTSKSQALRSVILRLMGVNENAETIWRIASVISFLSLFVFWYKIATAHVKIRIYAYCLGVLAFVMLMPQSLPYQFFKLLIPLIFIVNEFISTRKKRFGVILFFVFVFCSISTSDLIGQIDADIVQYDSLPFLTFFCILIVIIKEIFLIKGNLNQKSLTP